MEGTRKAKRRKTKATTEIEKVWIFHQMFKHDVRNALAETTIPLLDPVYGP